MSAIIFAKSGIACGKPQGFLEYSSRGLVPLRNHGPKTIIEVSEKSQGHILNISSRTRVLMKKWRFWGTKTRKRGAQK